MLFNVPWHIVVLLLGNSVCPRCHACFAGQMNYPHLPPLVLVLQCQWFACRGSLCLSPHRLELHVHPPPLFDTM
jgi:hypothetical protein